MDTLSFSLISYWITEFIKFILFYALPTLTKPTYSIKYCTSIYITYLSQLFHVFYD